MALMTVPTHPSASHFLAVEAFISVRMSTTLSSATLPTAPPFTHGSRSMLTATTVPPPLLYQGRVELKTDTAYLSFVTGLRSIVQDIEAPTSRLVQKPSYTSGITSIGLCGVVDHAGADELLLRLGPSHPCEIEIRAFHFPPISGPVTTSLPEEAKYWLNETLKRDCRIGGLDHWRQRDRSAPIYCSSIIAEFTCGAYPGSLESYEFGLKPPPKDRESATLRIRSRFVHTLWSLLFFSVF